MPLYLEDVERNQVKKYVPGMFENSSGSISRTTPTQIHHHIREMEGLNHDHEDMGGFGGNNRIKILKIERKNKNIIIMFIFPT